MKKRILIIAAAALALAAAVFVAVGIITQHQRKQAFRSSNEKYRHVQIEITQKGKNYSPAIMDDLEYENDEISFEDGSGNTTEYDLEKTVQLVKAENVYLEETQGRKTYFYRQGDKEYVLTDISSAAEEDGEGVWEAIPAEEVQVVKSFDFSVLDQLDLGQMDRKGSRFTVQEAYLNDALFLLLNVSDSLQKDYRCDRMEFVLKGGTLSRIHVEFAYLADLYMEYDYSFSYADREITMPQQGSTNQE